MVVMDSLAIAYTALMSQKLRTFLASLGIVIGIAAVIIMVGVGKGSQKEVMDIIQNMGENLITVNAGEAKRRGGKLRLFGNITTMKLRDVRALENQKDVILRVVPFEYAPINVKYGDVTVPLNVGGTVPSFLDVRKYVISSGEMFEETDAWSGRRLAVLGKKAADKFFGLTDPIGKTIRVKTIPFKVIGIFESKGVDADGVDQDDIVVVPLMTMIRRVLSQTYIKTMYVQATSRKNMPLASQRIREVLREQHRLADDSEDDFTIQNQVQLEKMKMEAENMFTVLIVGVAAISLIVGGIGILAVMLISVKERTREIGVRRAVGATRLDIVKQFLAESMIIGVIGGLAGAGLGVAITLGLSFFSPWALLLDQKAAIISTLVCTFIGILFGLYPAFKASNLDPMDALRVE
tara:strand:- start:1490 stop:2710 length:1221 start_codon:yes stop_codon:yes gene_type:complete